MTAFNTVPGFRAGSSITPRNIFAANLPPTWNHGEVNSYLISGSSSGDTGSVIAGNSVALLRDGLILGKITATGKLTNSIVGVLLGNMTAAATTGYTSAGAILELTRLAAAGETTFTIYGPPTAAATVAMCTVSFASGTATTATWTAGPSAAMVKGSVIMRNNGAQVPRTVLSGTPGNCGLFVKDIAGSYIDQNLPALLSTASLITKQIINLAVDESANAIDTSVTTALKASLNANAGNFKFSDDWMSAL